MEAMLEAKPVEANPSVRTERHFCEPKINGLLQHKPV
jgi:hypothetical protein